MFICFITYLLETLQQNESNGIKDREFSLINPERIKYPEGIIAVDSVDDFGINLYEEYGGISCEYTLNNILPIPLSEEWLVKFGIRRFLEYCFCLDEVAANIEFDTGQQCWCFHSHKIYLPLKYVHQLQNLYFALTGEELILK